MFKAKEGDKVKIIKKLKNADKWKFNPKVGDICIALVDGFESFIRVVPTGRNDYNKSDLYTLIYEDEYELYKEEKLNKLALYYDLPKKEYIPHITKWLKSLGKKTNFEDDFMSGHNYNYLFISSFSDDFHFDFSLSTGMHKPFEELYELGMPRIEESTSTKFPFYVKMKKPGGNNTSHKRYTQGLTDYKTIVKIVEEDTQNYYCVDGYVLWKQYFYTYETPATEQEYIDYCDGLNPKPISLEEKAKKFVVGSWWKNPKMKKYLSNDNIYYRIESSNVVRGDYIQIYFDAAASENWNIKIGMHLSQANNEYEDAMELVANRNLYDLEDIVNIDGDSKKYQITKFAFSGAGWIYYLREVQSSSSVELQIQEPRLTYAPKETIKPTDYEVGDMVIVGESNVKVLNWEGNIGVITNISSNAKYKYQVEIREGYKLYCDVVGYAPTPVNSQSLPPIPKFKHLDVVTIDGGDTFYCIANHQIVGGTIIYDIVSGNNSSINGATEERLAFAPILKPETPKELHFQSSKDKTPKFKTGDILNTNEHKTFSVVKISWNEDYNQFMYEGVGSNYQETFCYFEDSLSLNTRWAGESDNSTLLTPIYQFPREGLYKYTNGDDNFVNSLILYLIKNGRENSENLSEKYKNGVAWNSHSFWYIAKASSKTEYTQTQLIAFIGYKTPFTPVTSTELEKVFNEGQLQFVKESVVREMFPFEVGDVVECIEGRMVTGTGWVLGKQFTIDHFGTVNNKKGRVAFPYNQSGVWEDCLKLVVRAAFNQEKIESRILELVQLEDVLTIDTSVKRTKPLKQELVSQESVFYF
jgi:hypothetical protein